jgi:DNA-binding winged helix-turn-helix (wHTH) protein
MESSGQKAAVLKFGAYEADLRSGELRKHGLRIKIQEKPFQILALLLERPGEVVTREELRQRLWPADTFVDFDHGLNSAINKLRDALGDTAANPRFIETLARRGYRFIGPIAAEGGTQATATAAPALETPTPIPAPANYPDEELPRAPRSVVRLLFALAQVLYLVLYIIALAQVDELHAHAALLVPRAPLWVTTAAVFVAAIGVPVRLYLLTAVAFDYPRLGQKFIRIFPGLLLLDQLWALTPFLIVNELGLGIAIASAACLLYLPFSQRTLIRMGYGAALGSKPVQRGSGSFAN